MKTYFLVLSAMAITLANAEVSPRPAFGGFFVRIQGTGACATTNFLTQNCTCPTRTEPSTVVVVSSIGTLEWTLCVDVAETLGHDADFGGAFQCLSDGHSQECMCTTSNPVTGNCSCPSAGKFTEVKFDAVSPFSDQIAAPVTLCPSKDLAPHSPLGRICGSSGCQCDSGYDALSLPGQILLTENKSSNASFCVKACSALNMTTCTSSTFAAYCGTCQSGSTCFNRNTDWCCDGESVCSLDTPDCSRDWQGTLQCCPSDTLACFPGTCYNSSAESCCLTIPGSWGQTCPPGEECCATQVGATCCPQGTTCWTDYGSLSTCVPSGMMACANGEQAWSCPTNTQCGSNNLMCLLPCASTNCQLNATCCQGPDENYCCGSNTTCVYNQIYGAHCSLMTPPQQISCSLGSYYWGCPSNTRCSQTDVEVCLSE